MVGCDAYDIDFCDAGIVKPLRQQRRSIRCRMPLKPRIRRGVFTLAEVLPNLRHIHIRVHARALGIGHAMRGPGINKIRLLGKVRSRINMPILRRDNHVIVVLRLKQLINSARHLITAFGAQGTTRAEIILDINNNQCFGHTFRVATSCTLRRLWITSAVA